MADLLLRRAVDRLPRGLRLDHPDPVRPADDRRVRHRPAGLELRLPQGGVPHPRPPQLRRRLRLVVGARPVLLRRHRRRHRLGPRARRRSGRRPVDSWVNPTSVLGGVLAVVVVAYLAAVYLVWDARRLGDEPMVEYFRRRAVGAAVVAGVVAFVGIFVLRADAAYLFDELTTKALPLVLLSALCGTASLVLLARDARTRRPAARHRRRGQHRGRLGRGAVAVHPAREPRGRRRRRAVGHARRAARRRRSAPCSSCSPASSCSTSSTRRACSRRRASTDAPTCSRADTHEPRHRHRHRRRRDRGRRHGDPAGAPPRARRQLLPRRRSCRRRVRRVGDRIRRTARLRGLPGLRQLRRGARRGRGGGAHGRPAGRDGAVLPAVGVG